jgi:hypothetical protein
MTLIITLGAPWGVFRSSDYCLSDPATGKPVQIEAGTKQLSAQGLKWIAEVAFTGVARVGSYQTREWISAAFAKKDDTYSLTRIILELAQSGTTRLRFVDKQLRHLSICISTVIESSIRFILISNFEPLTGLRSNSVAGGLQVFETPLTRPRIFIHGMREAVTRADRRLLLGMLKHNASREEIWAALGHVNKRASEKSGGRISSQCMLTELSPSGTINSQNVGGAAGVPDSFLSGINMGELIRNNFRTENGKFQVLKDGNWVDA